MSRRAAALLIAVAVLVLLVAVAAGLGRRARRAPAGAGEAVAAAPPPPATAPWSARLWLPGEQERLVTAAVEVESGDEARARAAAVLEALLAARPEPPAAPLFTEPVGVAKLLLVEGTAYVDLRPRSGGEPPSSGSSDELMRVYAIVHTLVGNVPEVRQVVLLWNGVQRRGFPGHVDTGRPLVPLPALETP